MASNPLKAFVGNLPYSWDSDELADLARTYGKVTGVSIVYDRETGKSKGFGFVTYSDAASAEQAIAGIHGRMVEGRQLTCKSAMPRGSGPGEAPSGAAANSPDPAVADPFLQTSQKAKKVSKSQKNVPGWGDWS